MIVARIIALLIGYGFGLFQTGYLYGKSKGIDIRQQGSGNAGTTNSLRVLGWKAGIITFAGDLLKAVFAVLLVKLDFSWNLWCGYQSAGTVCRFWNGLRT